MKYPLYLSALLAGLTGCLSVPGDEAPPMCEQTSDCDSANGEICADGVCWGDPPAADYAARIGPPGNRDGLVPTEITKVSIDANGWFTTTLRLETPVTISGRVSLSCGEPSCPAIASTITVSRPARIPGGPPFVAVGHTTEESGAYQIAVPRAEPGEDYAVVIAPDRLAANRINLDDAAPTRLLINPVDSVDGLDAELGGGVGRTVTGVVLDTNGTGLEGARVVVRGRWTGDGAVTEISSVATTTGTGAFTLYLPDSTFDSAAQVVIAPPAEQGTLRPTLSVALDLSTGATSMSVATLEMPDLGPTQEVTIPITGTSTMGVVEPVTGAEVTLTARLEIPRVPLPPALARIEVSGTTLTTGAVRLPVLTDPRLDYELTVKPPPQGGAAAYATEYGSGVTIESGTNTLPAVHLANQVSVRGVLRDHHGRAAEGVVVSVLPNAVYAANLPEALQATLAEVVQTGESTNDDGEFAVFVDPKIGGAPALYDVRFEPPIDSLLPSFQKLGLTVDQVNGLDLEDLMLPPAAYVRTVVFDPADQPIEGAEVRLYEIPAEVRPCDTGCRPVAILRAQGLSDAGGEVHLVLPDP